MSEMINVVPSEVLAVTSSMIVDVTAVFGSIRNGGRFLLHLKETGLTHRKILVLKQGALNDSIVLAVV
ncbi:12589_t:CDS:2 [Rhizophagus irregularis]|nr:12589_t:CDS:2 [Rhizophagus irregularis]